MDQFQPAQLADVLSAYANMVHHPGPLIEPLNERLMPKLDSMGAGQQPLQLSSTIVCCCDLEQPWLDALVAVDDKFRV